MQFITPVLLSQLYHRNSRPRCPKPTLCSCLPALVGLIPVATCE